MSLEAKYEALLKQIVYSVFSVVCSMNAKLSVT